MFLKLLETVSIRGRNYILRFEPLKIYWFTELADKTDIDFFFFRLSRWFYNYNSIVYGNPSSGRGTSLTGAYGSADNDLLDLICIDHIEDYTSVCLTLQYDAIITALTVSSGGFRRARREPSPRRSNVLVEILVCCIRMF